MRVAFVPAAALAVLLPACSSLSVGTDGKRMPPAAFKPIRNPDGFILYSAGAEAWLVDPKDRGLREALALLDERVAELPAELGKPAFPAPEIALALDLLGSRIDLRAGLDQGAPVPFYAQLLVDSGSEAAARDLAARFAEALRGRGVPSLGISVAMHNLQTIPGPLPLFHGAPRHSFDNASGPERLEAFVIAANEVRLDPIELGTLDLPAGVKPFCAWKVDYGQCSRAIEAGARMAAAAGGKGAAVVNPLPMLGLDAVVAQGGMGYGSDRLYFSSRQRGYAPAARKAGMLAGGPLSRREIAMVPADATWAALWRANPRGILPVIRKAIAAQAEQSGMPADADPLEMISAATGFDLEKDLFDHLGQTWGAYTSVSTGGGGLLSAVAFVRIEDEKGFRETLRWIESEVNGALETRAAGHVAIRTRTLGDVEMSALAFPGLPVPIEVAYALADGWLYVGFSPQAVSQAIAQARHGELDLTDHPRFRAMASGSLEDLYSLSFADTPALAREGYGLVSLACAAIANGVRSPRDASRDPGMILASWPEVERDAKAMVCLGRLDGDDLVTLGQGDRSMLVNACGIAGLLGGTPALATLVAAAAASSARGKSDERRNRLEAKEGGSEESGDEPREMQERREEPDPDSVPR